MQTLETKNRFIELRAQGLSYDKIAQELQVTKQTLINWSKESRYEIANLRTIQKEALLDRLELSEKARLERLSQITSKIQEELSKRDLTQVPTEKLTEMYIKFLELNKKSIMPLIFVTKEGYVLENLSTETKWVED